MCGVNLMGVMLFFSFWLPGIELGRVERGLVIPGAVKAFAERNLTAEEVHTILKKRAKEGGSSRFVEQEALLKIVQNRLRYKLSYIFGNATLHSPNTIIFFDGNYRKASVAEWKKLREQKGKQLRRKIHHQAEQELQEWKAVSGLSEARIYKSEENFYCFIEKKKEKVLRKGLGECRICLKQMNINNTIETTECVKPHLFHRSCAMKWYLSARRERKNPTCPLCRADFKYKRKTVEAMARKSPYPIEQQCMHVH